MVALLRNLADKAVLYLRMIKFSHSVFALPFALTGAFIAAAGAPRWKTLFWIIVAMVSARTAAMGLNRIIDRNIDRENPRTSKREIPAGRIAAWEAALFAVMAIVVFIASAYMLNPLCFKLSWVALMFLFLYSYTKRFTWASHFVLGITISAAPVGAWIAVTGYVDPRILFLGLAVVFWLAGFDILYALQDLEFDRRYGLHSIPQRFGIRNALFISRFCHCITWVSLFATGIAFQISTPFFIGLAIIAGLLLYEHSLVRATDLSRLNMAFFNMNGYISLTVFVFTLLSYL